MASGKRQRPRQKWLVPLGWPFQSNPEVYPQFRNKPRPQPQPGLSRSMKRYFSVMRRNAIMIFTYDDSDEFLPDFYHSFDLEGVRAMRWSPLGSSLLCLRHDEVFVLRTEPSFEEFMFHVDGEVSSAEFSAKENYISLMHWLSHNQQLMNIEVREAKTGEIRQVFGSATYSEASSVKSMDYLKWDYNDNYFAALLDRGVVVYETEKFSRIKKFKQIREFGWSPSASILALFGDSYIKIVDICNGKKLYGCRWEGVDYYYKLLWQSDGEYLACLCIGTDCNKIYLISLKSGKAEFITPDCDYIDFAWGGNGKQFAVSRGTNNAGQTTVNFYIIQEDGVHLVKTVQGMIAHFLHWSPNGRHIVMQGPLNGPGELYFYDVENHQQLAFVHFIARDFRWDFSGRFFLTRATIKNWRHQVVQIWSSQGEKLIDVGPFDLYMVWSNKVSFAGGSSKDDGKRVLGKRLQTLHVS